MEFSTNLDEIILYKNTVQKAIGMDDNILAFLSDDPNIKAGSPKASEILSKTFSTTRSAMIRFRSIPLLYSWRSRCTHVRPTR